MRCPRCNEENPEGRGFCIKCAYPLPETPQQNQQPPVEPIRFEQPTPNYYPQNVQGNPYPNPAPVVRKRPVGLGIASLILGISALTAALWAILWAALPFNQYMSDYESYYSGSTAAQLPQGTVTTIFVIVYAFFAILMGILGLIFGIKALGRCRKEPNRYMGKPMYLAGVITSAAALAFSFIVLIVSIATIY
jgi:hypothetical protein